MSDITATRVINPAGQAFEIKSVAYSSVTSVTRPNDSIQYSSGDVISNSTSSPTALTFSGMGPIQGHVIIDTVEMFCDSTAVPSGNAPFRLHLYSTEPTAINDNAAYNLASGDLTSYQGYLDVSGFQDLGDNIFTFASNIKHHVVMTSGETNIYGILEIRGDCPSAPNKKISITLKGSEV